jgi:hypothetical protein
VSTKTLYHGTSSLNLSCIKRIGLEPGHAKGGDEWAKDHHMLLAEEAEHRAPSVFLTDRKASATDFARAAVEEMGGHPVVITLQVPLAMFSTFTVDELFEQDDEEPHAWRVHSVPASCVAEVIPVSPGIPSFEASMSIEALLSSLLERSI